jgi:hypothetical protein
MNRYHCNSRTTDEQIPKERDSPNPTRPLNLVSVARDLRRDGLKENGNVYD